MTIRPKGYLGLRALAALTAFAALGFTLAGIGIATSNPQLKVIGAVFAFWGGGWGVGLIIRWTIYRKIR